MRVDTTMGHRTITISDEAYRELSKMKKEWESFTDVVLRLASGRGSAKALTAHLKAPLDRRPRREHRDRHKADQEGLSRPDHGRLS
jgi:Putative antitoxin